MKKGIQIGLKPGERIFINGAVLRVDRKVSIELMNDVTFLLESHVMQPEEARSPIRQLYFIIQTMLMDPSTVENTRMVFERTQNLLLAAIKDPELLEGLRSVGSLIEEGRNFEALKAARVLFPVEDKILSSQRAEEAEQIKREVA